MSDMITVDRLVVWCQRICTVESPETTQLVRELGLPATLKPVSHGFELEPPLPGTNRVRLVGDNGVFEYLELEFEAATLTHADIESWFGAGKSTPRVHWESSHKLFYMIDYPDAPHGCDMFAEFAVEPAGDTPLIGVMMRRRRASG